MSTSQPSPADGPSLRAPTVGATIGFACAASLVAGLTVSINPLFAGRPDQMARLVFLFLIGGAALGAALGLFAAALLGLLGRWPSERIARAVVALASGLPITLLVVPPLLTLLLPDFGVTGGLLTRLLSLPTSLGLVLLGMPVLLLTAVFGQLAPRTAVLRLPRIASVVGIVTTLLLLSLTRRVEAPPARVPFDQVVSELPSPAPRAAAEPAQIPILLLCVDALDPDDVLWPLADAGELPTFDRLRREGVVADLDTLTPTLSPAIWTTLVTGKGPEEHGVHHFVVFDLPFVDVPVQHFPLHTGLNFELIPRLERLPGAPVVRVPYTSSMRRSPALWEMVATRRPVGVYRWRNTSPAEQLPGFVIPEGVSLGPGGNGPPTGFHPPRLRLARPRPADDASVRRSLSAQWQMRDLDQLAETDNRVRWIRRRTRDPVVDRLLDLYAEFSPALVAASFLSVDETQHMTSRDRVGGGPLASAVDESYRLLDQRLGELMDRFQARFGDFHLILVSDHGFDFDQHHHTQAPPGVIVAWGPKFRTGATLEELDVFDVTPLVLTLLGLPVARDMSGAVEGNWLGLFREPPEVSWIDSWGSREGFVERLTDSQSEADRETIERLKALGYLN